jgi:hypothetical protein
MTEQKSAGRPANPNRKQRINVTFSPDTLAELESRIPEKQRSEHIEALVRKDLGLPPLESGKMTGFAAYRRGINAGFATETVLVNDGIIVDQFTQTYQEGDEVDRLRNRVGQPMASLKGLGFRRVTKASEVEQLHERYLATAENVE